MKSMAREPYFEISPATSAEKFMWDIELLENRLFFSAAKQPAIPNPYVFQTGLNKYVAEPGGTFKTVRTGPYAFQDGWDFDLSGAPESPVTVENDVTKLKFLQPTISNAGRLQIYGTVNSDQISITQVTGLDSKSDLPAFIYVPNTDSSQSSAWVYDFVGSQSNLLPNGKKALVPANKLLKEYQQELAANQANPPAGWDKADVTAANGIIQAINSETKSYQTMIKKYQNTALTRVDVAGLFDVYTLATNPPAIIAIDSGAGNDTISVAPDVQSKLSVVGGKGNDTITSGSRHAYLSGGAGDDVLIGRSKHGGTLDGGAGSDTLESRDGNMNIVDVDSSDHIIADGTNYPISTALAATNGAASGAKSIFSDLFLTPDGLT